jgi:hypothetical protein
MIACNDGSTKGFVMTEQERANAFVTVLTKLTLGNVALGLALAAGGVLVWGQIYEVKAGAVTLLIAVIVGSLLVAMGAAMWSKLEAMQLSADARWQAQVNILQTEIDDIRPQLAACLARDLAAQERDRAAQARMSALEKKLAALNGRVSDFGDLGG